MNVTIVGMGLIGGSFYKAAQVAGHSVVGLHHGDELPSRQVPSAKHRAPGANLILVCLPPEAIVPWIREHATSFAPGTIVVDICGVKRPIMGEMENLFSSVINNQQLTTNNLSWTFVGGHPMAGLEVSGFANSKADLFVGASMILTPFAETPDAVIGTLKTFFASVGFHETVVTTPERHDDMIAFTSQLCHVIATTYARDVRVRDAIGFSAGSYANMTRIATQDADVWSELYRTNRNALVGVLDDFAARFKDLRDAIARDDKGAVHRIIEEGTKAKRQELLDRHRGDG